MFDHSHAAPSAKSRMGDALACESRAAKRGLDVAFAGSPDLDAAAKVVLFQRPRAAHGPCPQRTWVFCRTSYQIATAGIAQTARAVSIHKATRFSDHAPLTIGYDMAL